MTSTVRSAGTGASVIPHERNSCFSHDLTDLLRDAQGEGQAGKKPLAYTGFVKGLGELKALHELLAFREMM